MNVRLVLLAALILAWVGALPVRAGAPEEQLAAASALFDAKKFPEAAKRLEAFVRAYPKHPKLAAASLALGRARTEMKQWAQAIPAYEKAAAGKDPDIAPLAQLGLGEAAIHAEQYAKAVAALGIAAKGTLDGEQAALVWYWLGQANFELEHFAAAEDAYRKVTQSYGQSPWADGAHLGAGLSTLRQGKTDAARRHLRTLVDRFPQSPDRPQAQLVLAQLDLDAKRWNEARAGFEAVLQTKGRRGEVQTAAEEGLVRALLALKDYNGAAERLQTALGRLPAADPQRPRVQLTLGHSRYGLKQYELALTAYDEAAKSSDNAVAAEASYWAGNAAQALNRSGEAAARWTIVVTRHKQAAQAAAAQSALRALVDQATDPGALQAALRSAPSEDRARITLRLARLFLDQKQYVRAQAPLTALLQAKPQPKIAGEAQYLLGLACEGDAKPDKALAAFAEAARLGSTEAWTSDAQTRLAWLQVEKKRPAQAEQSARAALAAKPGAPIEQQARLALLQALLDQQKWDAARTESQTLLAGNPSSEVQATVLFAQAWASDKQNRPTEALALWERLAAEHPNSGYAAEALVRSGDARLKAQNYEAAREKYATVLSGFAQNALAAEARFKLGTALFHLNRFDEASTEWDKVTTDKTAGSYAPEALYWTGVALDKAGKKADAIERLDRLVVQHPAHARVANAKIRLAALKAVSGG